MKFTRGKMHLLLLLCLTLTACTTTMDEEVLAGPVEDLNKEAKVTEEIVEIPDPIEVRISAVGDIMVHGPQIRAQFDDEKGKYDFTNNFQFIKPYIEEADLALANLETTLAGKERAYSGYPLFNSPDELAYALKYTGFNGIVTTNNHSFDTGELGLLRTIETLKSNQLTPIGTRKQESDQSYKIFDVNGIKVGVSAYTYETPSWRGMKTLNGIAVPEELEELIDSFNYETLEVDLLKMKNRIQKMKEEGAEFIVFYMHWGHEYHREPNTYQRRIAQTLSNYGVDIIFGSHPHVLQPIEWVESELSDHKTLVAYSMGNFISNQRYETLGNRYTEDGVIVNVDIIKDFEKERVKIEEVTIIPTWVHRYWQDGKTIYEVLPLIDAIRDPRAYNLNSQEQISRAQRSKEATVSHLLKEGEGIALEEWRFLENIADSQ